MLSCTNDLEECISCVDSECIVNFIPVILASHSVWLYIYNDFRNIVSLYILLLRFLLVWAILYLHKWHFLTDIPPPNPSPIFSYHPHPHETLSLYELYIHDFWNIVYLYTSCISRWPYSYKKKMALKTGWYIVRWCLLNVPVIFVKLWMYVKTPFNFCSYLIFITTMVK